MQWHPIFAYLLRPLVESCYEVQTDVPVGDLPRKSDITLVRKTADSPPPFRGLWRWLTPLERVGVQRTNGLAVIRRVARPD